MKRIAHNRKGLIAIMDALIAYSIAFIFIGAIALSLANADHDMGRKTLIMNQYAEDIAEDIAQSMQGYSRLTATDGSTSKSTSYQLVNYAPYRAKTRQDVVDRLISEVENLVKKDGLKIKITITDPEDDVTTDGTWMFPNDPDIFNDAEYKAVARRILLYDKDNGEYKLVGPSDYPQLIVTVVI